jgi:hydroxymethylbilane synthase
VLNDPISHQCVDLERAVVQALNGDCHSPIAALATVGEEGLSLRVAVGRRGGETPVVEAQATGEGGDGEPLLKTVLEKLEAQGARALLHDGP